MPIFPIAFALAMVMACGETSRPPAVAEVPINENVPPKNGSDDPPDNTTTPPPDTGNVSGTGPKPLAVTTPEPDAGVAKKGVLSEADCKKVIKKLADFIQKDNHQPPVAQTDLENNPVFNPMLTECEQETTKKQYTCAIGAKNKTAWEACMK